MLSLYNTKTREKERFMPMQKGLVGMYHCGPTVYNFAHIGNLRAYVFADIVRRTFELKSYAVRQVINITDVGHLVSDADHGEDKMEKGARREGKTAQEIARFYEEAFFADLEALHIETHGTIFPRATEHIAEQIALITKIEATGNAYQTSDGIYFDTAQFPTYADFARLDLTHLKSGARIAENTEKRNPSDFALWKFSKPEEQRQMEWDSPWGKGFPGWHIECSAMSMKYLGETFDIHTGGIDHIPVHHTNEIAQSECANGKPFARYWMHTEFVTTDGDKMAKSEENFLRLASLAEHNIHPLALRYWFLSAHYRSPLSFSWEALDGAQRGLVRLITFASAHNTETDAPSIVHFKQKFERALSNDFNTAQALAIMWDMLQDESFDVIERIATLVEMDRVLGFGLRNAQALLSSIAGNPIPLNELPDNIKKLVEERMVARQQKKWDEADSLREQLQKAGYTIADQQDETVLRQI